MPMRRSKLIEKIVASRDSACTHRDIALKKPNWNLKGLCLKVMNKSCDPCFISCMQLAYLKNPKRKGKF